MKLFFFFFLIIVSVQSWYFNKNKISTKNDVQVSKFSASNANISDTIITDSLIIPIEEDFSSTLCSKEGSMVFSKSILYVCNGTQWLEYKPSSDTETVITDSLIIPVEEDFSSISCDKKGSMVFSGSDLYVCSGTHWLEYQPVSVSSETVPVEDVGLDLGSTCSNNNECESSYCSDRVCCNKVCNSDCISCTMPGLEGTCMPKSKGTACGAGSCSGAVFSQNRCDNGVCSSVSENCGYKKCIASRTLETGSCSPLGCISSTTRCGERCQNDPGRERCT